MPVNQGLTGSARKQLLTIRKQLLTVCLFPRAAARARLQNQSQWKGGRLPLQPPLKIPP